MGRADSLGKTLLLRNRGQEEQGATEDEMVGWHHRLNGYEFEQTLGDSEGQEAWQAAIHGVTKSWIQLSDWTTTTNKPSNHMSSSKVIVILLSIFFALCVLSLWLIHFITGGLPFNPLHLFIALLLATTLLFESVFIALFFRFHIWDNSVLAFLFLTYFTWHNTLYIHLCCHKW